MKDYSTIDATFEKIEDFDQSTPSYPPLNNSNFTNNHSQFGTTAEPSKFEPPKDETVATFVNLEVISQVGLFSLHYNNNRVPKYLKYSYLLNQDKDSVFFKIRNTSAFTKLINAYCERKGIASCELTYKGEVIQPEQTPKDVRFF